MNDRWALGALFAVSLLLGPPAALADEPVPKRPLPDYDGRPPEESTAEEVALAVPRVVLFPLWLVSEYGLRRPLEWLVVNAEKNKWPTLLLDFFTFEERTIGVFPTALFDFGLRTSVGVYSFWNKAIFDENSVRLYAAYGGDDWRVIRLTDRVLLEENTTLAFTLGYGNRPDYPFYGVGPTADDERVARYESERLEALASVESLLGDSGSLRAFATVRRVEFGDGTAFEEPALGELVAAGLVEAPPGFGSPYTLYGHGLELAFDTRRARPATGSGVRLEIESSQHFHLEDGPAAAAGGRPGASQSPILGYGGALGGFLDLTRQHRVVSLFVSAHFVEPLESDGIVPFTEQLTAGGAGPLTGFLDRAILGESTLAARLEYRWPVWVFLDGTLHVAVGNVFGRRAEDFEWDRLRMSFGFGMRTVGRPDHAFNMIFALGTETFEQGADVTSVRFALGTSRGF